MFPIHFNRNYHNNEKKNSYKKVMEEIKTDFFFNTKIKTNVFIFAKFYLLIYLKMDL